MNFKVNCYRLVNKSINKLSMWAIWHTHAHTHTQIHTTTYSFIFLNKYKDMPKYKLLYTSTQKVAYIPQGFLS